MKKKCGDFCHISVERSQVILFSTSAAGIHLSSILFRTGGCPIANCYRHCLCRPVVGNQERSRVLHLLSSQRLRLHLHMPNSTSKTLKLHMFH
jgi:hypothetical protein